MEYYSPGYRCKSCQKPCPRRGGYTDFLVPGSPYLSSVQIDFSDHYVMPETPYWDALRQATQLYSTSLIAVFKEALGRRATCLDIGKSIVEGGTFKSHLTGYAEILSTYCVVDPDARQLDCNDDRFFMARGVGEVLSFGAAAFDLILLHATLDHCVNYHKTLDECYRVLAPGGLLSIELNNNQSWAKRVLPWSARRRRDAAAKDHHVFLSPAILAADLKQRDFEVIHLRGLRYLLLPSFVLEALCRLFNAYTPKLIRVCDAMGNRFASSLGGDFHLIARKLPTAAK